MEIIVSVTLPDKGQQNRTQNCCCGSDVQDVPTAQIGLGHNKVSTEWTHFANDGVTHFGQLHLIASVEANILKQVYVKCDAPSRHSVATMGLLVVPVHIHC